MIDPEKYEIDAAMCGLENMYEYLASINATDLNQLTHDQARHAALAFAGTYHEKLIELAPKVS